MEKPVRAGNVPQMENLEKGINYAWCSCGKSNGQPWCDGSHKDTSFTPMIFNTEDDKKGAICLCKQTKNPPYCDGSHNQ